MTLPFVGSVKRRAGAVIAYRAGAAFSGNTTSFSVVIPATAKAGDVAFLVFDYNFVTAAITTGPNLTWTQLGTEQQDASEIGSRVWWRKLAGGDPGTTITITVAATLKGNMVVEVYSGVDGTNPIVAFAQASETGTSDKHSTPSASNTADGAWRLDYVQDKAATATAIWSAPSTSTIRHATYTTGTGLTAAVGDSNGPVFVGSQGLQLYDSDQSTAKATMWTVLFRPGTSVANPNGGKIVFGMYNNCTTTASDGYSSGSYPGDTSAHYAEINAAYMDAALVRVRRSFNQTIPANLAASSGANDAANNLVPFMSLKADPAAVAAGTFDTAIATFATSCTGNPTYLTYQHEPENDMSGATFVAAFQRFYDKVKAANANCLVGPSHLLYQWKSGQTSTATPDDWWVGSTHCDFIAGDVYEFDWQAAVSLGSSSDSGFTRWYPWAAAKGKPLVLTEFGIRVDSTDPNPARTGKHFDSERVTALGDSLDFLKSAGFVMVLYWNGYHSDVGVNDFNISPTVSASGGHPTVLSVWNTKVGLYGSTSPDIRDVV